MSLPDTDSRAAAKPLAAMTDVLSEAVTGSVPNGRLRGLMISDVCHPRVNGVSRSIETFGSALARLGIRFTLVAPECRRRPRPLNLLAN
jgi:hypothetical protein